MSLINDALKRANESTPPPRPPTEAPPALRPAEYKTPATWPLLMLPLALFLVFGFAGWFLWHGWQTNRDESLPHGATPVAAREQPPATTPAPQPAGRVEPVAVTTPTPVETAPPPAAPVATTAVESAKTEFPNLKLQGIFFRASNPSAMINAKTFYVGDKIQGAKVLSITQDTVTMEFSGQTSELTLR